MSSSSDPQALRLADQVAIVTGGSSGFGKDIVETFVKHGARVVVMDLNATDGPLQLSGQGSAYQIKADVCSADDWRKAVDACRSRFDGRTPSIIVNNAGWTYSNKSTLDVTEQELDKVFDVNVKSIYFSVSVVVPLLQQAKQPGTFIAVASTAGVRPRPKLTWYNASKAAVITAQKAMALEFAKDQIRFNTINPVAGNTPLLSKFAGALNVGDALTDEQLKQFNDSVPLGRLSMPSDIANAALFLADPASHFLTGIDINVDGGRCV